MKSHIVEDHSIGIFQAHAREAFSEPVGSRFGIDKEIEQLVRYFQQIDHVHTLFSCSGHNHGYSGWYLDFVYGKFGIPVVESIMQVASQVVGVEIKYAFRNWPTSSGSMVRYPFIRLSYAGEFKSGNISSLNYLTDLIGIHLCQKSTPL